MNSVGWLFWLLTLNSVVNPWIYMIFNVNLVESLYRVCCPGLGLDDDGDGLGQGRARSVACPCPCLSKHGQAKASFKYRAQYQTCRSQGQVSSTYTTGKYITL